ncbi:MAG: hypothetical protein EA357_01910 [Micavibrio sp.]|nr:MAG: hypothetical protein EA357_01910 [Micavibrio sp.]
MDKKNLEKLVSAWIKMSSAEDESSEYEKNFWAAERMFKLVENNPEEAWIVLNAIRQATDDDNVLAHLAAGHLEDFINEHGEKFIDRFEELAKNDENFRRLLGGVWQRDKMSDNLCARLKVIALPPEWD